MERDAAVHVHVVVVNHHVPIHVGVDKTEDYRLVAHKCLVVAFGIVDCLFVGAAVGQLPEDGCRLPVLVFFLFYGLYPEIGDAHRHAVVEADASVAYLVGESGHTAHFLSNGDGVGVDFVDKFVGKRQICDCVCVLSAVVVVVIRRECLTESVVVVEHRRDTVEAESVEMILFKPELAVRQQEVKHLVLAVVEAERVPCRMFAARVAVEILVVAAVEASESFHLVFYGVGMHDVHNHGNAAAVGVIDETFQLVGRAEAARSGVEARHVVAERPVVWVFLNRHNLDGVIAVFFDARQHVDAEFLIGAYAFLVLAHADVAFVDEQRVGLGLEVGDLEFVRARRLPHLR